MPGDLSYEINGGLGFLRGWVPDSHFSERGREGRLIRSERLKTNKSKPWNFTCFIFLQFRVLQDTRNIAAIGTTKGFGVDEDTALVVTDLYTRPIGTVNHFMHSICCLAICFKCVLLM